MHAVTRSVRLPGMGTITVETAPGTGTTANRRSGRTEITSYVTATGVRIMIVTSGATAATPTAP